MKIIIKFIKNKITITGLTKDEELEVELLWTKVRDDYLDWVSEVRVKEFYKGKNIVKYFKWRNMSTWWFNRLVQKDSFVSNKWINRLMVMYLLKNYRDRVEIDTDDQIINKSIKRNKIKIHINPIANLNLRWIVNITRLTAHFVNHILITLILLRSSCEQVKCTDNSKPTIWFSSWYPVNWTGRGGGVQCDRLYGSSPLLDREYGFNTAYLIYYASIKLNNVIELYHLNGKLKALEVSSKRRFYYPEKKLTITDVFKIYFSTLLEQIKFLIQCNNCNFRSLFMINGMDVSDILIDEWSNNYWGFQQASKFRALATAKHFIQFCDGQIVITYGEFIAENRPIYYLTKVERPLTTFVSIQHGMNARNKTFTYHRRCEFNYNGIGYGVENSPFPDYFLTQGRQYEIFLKEFYESNRITTIGSLKSTNSESKKPNKSLQLNKVLGLKKRLLLIAPSVGEEYKGLIDLFSDWSYYNDWILVVSSHPASPIDRIAKYQINKFPDMRVSYITDASTVDIIKYCNLVVVGYSVLALEALQSNIAAVRYVPLGVFPQFDKDVQVPSFHNKHQFVEWFELFCNDIHQDSKVEYTKIAQKYIFKNDNRAGNRLWEFICKLHK